MSVGTTIRKPPGYERGRPTKLNKELQDRICQLISEGNYISTACGACGLDRSTYSKWLVRGEEHMSSEPPVESLYSAFYIAVKRAEANGEVALVKEVRDQVGKNAIAGLALLDRRFRDRWGQTPQQPTTTITMNVDKQLVTAGRKLEDTLKTMTARQSLDAPSETQHEVQRDA